MNRDLYEELLASIGSKSREQRDGSASGAMQAGMDGRYFKCDTRRELAAWFAGVSIHCRHILNGSPK
jgi:hypothetical protein